MDSSPILICALNDPYCHKSKVDVQVVFSGPLISPEAKARVESLIQSCVDEGGKIHLDGRGITVKGYENGNFVGPTIIEGTVNMRSYKWVFSSLSPYM